MSARDILWWRLVGRDVVRVRVRVRIRVSYGGAL